MATWFQQQSRQTELFKMLLSMAEGLNYTLVEPPYFIDYDDFRNDQPLNDPKAWIKLSNPEGRLLVLRPDLTTSVMDQLQWKSSDGPLKVSYYASTFIQDKERLEAKKEFGFEFFNAPRLEGEQQLVNTLNQFNQTFHLSLVCEVSHAQVFPLLISLAGFNSEQSTLFKTLLKTKAFDQLRPWLKLQNLNPSLLSLIETLIKPTSSVMKLKEKLTALGYLESFESILQSVQAFESFQSAPVIFDFSGMSTWSYYSGVMFQIYATDSPKVLIKGGRYVVERMNGEAIGFSLTLDDLMEVTA